MNNNRNVRFALGGRTALNKNYKRPLADRVEFPVFCFVLKKKKLRSSGFNNHTTVLIIFFFIIETEFLKLHVVCTYYAGTHILVFFNHIQFLPDKITLLFDYLTRLVLILIFNVCRKNLGLF